MVIFNPNLGYLKPLVSKRAYTMPKMLTKNGHIYAHNDTTFWLVKTLRNMIWESSLITVMNINSPNIAWSGRFLFSFPTTHRRIDIVCIRLQCHITLLPDNALHYHITARINKENNTGKQTKKHRLSHSGSECDNHLILSNFFFLYRIVWPSLSTDTLSACDYDCYALIIVLRMHPSENLTI